MTNIDGKPFTQLTNLNILDELRIKGVLIAAQIASMEVINQESDFPDAVAGVITLEDNRHYFIGSDISTANRFVLGANNLITTGSQFGPTLTYTGTGDMFTGVGVSCEFRNFKYSSPNANQTFNISDTVPNSSSFILSGSDCVRTPKVGTFTDLLSLNFLLSSFTDVDDGITMGGTATGLRLFDIDKLSFISADTGFIGVDLGSEVFSILEMRDFLLAAPSGAVGITGLTNSGNIASGSIGRIADSEFLGGMTPLVNVSRSDIRFNFRENAGVPNSTKTCNSYLSSSQTVTISTAGVFVPIAGANWISDVSERFSTTTAGVMTYLGETSSEIQITCTATLEKVGGGSDELDMRISINGVSQDSTTVSTENSTPTSLTCVGLFTIDEGDELRLDVANIGGTSNIIASHANAAIVNGF